MAKRFIGNSKNKITKNMINKHPLYKITAKENFFKSLASGIITRLGITCKLKDVTILLPTKLACYSLKKEFISLNYKEPNIYPISDLSGLVKLSAQYLERIPLINQISKIILSLKITKYQNISYITEVSEYLADILQKAETYKINLDKILKIIDNDNSLYTQELCNIIKIFIQEWKKNYNLTKAGYNVLLIDALASNIKNKQLIIAGINSDIPSEIQLLEKAYNSDNSYVVLYGVDEHLTNLDWNNISESHHQYNFKNIFNKLNVKPDSIEAWCKESTNSIFISKALKPAKSCDDWYDNKEYSQHVTYINALDQYDEAKNIIKIIKDNPTKSIMVVTAEDNLMEKLILYIDQDIENISIIRDLALSNSKAAIWLKLCLNFITEKFSLLSGLALLKHPFSSIDPTLLSELEILIRNNNFRSNNIFDAILEGEFFNNLMIEIESFNNFNQESSFTKKLQDHISFAERATHINIWEDDLSKEFKVLLDNLLEKLDIFTNLNLENYVILFNYFIKSAYFRPEITETKRVTILKPIDARLHTADLVVLAGLNEGIWPKLANIDPCFNNMMIEKIGFPIPEKSIGEEAFNFQCLANSESVILSRSEKIDSSIIYPSRWFLKLLTLSRAKITATALEKFTNNNQEEFFLPPSPAIEYRPTTLSVTQIEKLIYNPYHIYVDVILKLKKLSPLTKELSALDFGNFIHKAIEIKHYHPKESYIEAGNKALNSLKLSNNNQLKLLWWPRFIRITEWLKENQNFYCKDFLETPGRINILDNFTIISRADKIEIDSNKINIIDYKTGNISSSKSIYTGQTLQLLIEGLIAIDGGFSCQYKKKKYQLNSLKYIQLSGLEEPAKILEININDKPIIDQTKKYLGELLEEYRSSSTSYYYTKKKVLSYCYYEHLSRSF